VLVIPLTSLKDEDPEFIEFRKPLKFDVTVLI
jgi:hypothetical protein